VNPVTRVTLALATVLVVASIWVYPRLPPRIPAHFGARGDVNRWADTGILSWFGPVILALVLVALVEAAARWIIRNPRRVNTPDPARFAALSPGAQRLVAQEGVRPLRWVGILVVLLMGTVQWSVLQGARGTGGASLGLALALGLGLVVGPVLAFRTVVRTQALVDRLHREESSAARRPEG
jgi:hypothetical protein